MVLRVFENVKICLGEVCPKTAQNRRTVSKTLTRPTKAARIQNEMLFACKNSVCFNIYIT